MKNIRIICLGALVCMVAFGAMAATKSTANKKQSAIQMGTTVRTRVEAKGTYDQECYDAYYGCMDQFCITDNSNGGSCACSDKNEEYEKRLSALSDKLVEAERIKTIEVEKVKAGGDADIIFNGKREYDENGNIIGVDDTNKQDTKAKKRAELMAVFENNLNDDEDDDVFETDDDVSNKTGDALFSVVKKLCTQQMPEKCSSKDINFFHQLYSRQIVSDCKAFDNALNAKELEADVALASANNEVYAARKESLEAANKYDLGQCMVEFKKCMQTEDACGKDWEKCVFTVASENMQNNKAQSTAGTSVATVDTYDITASTLEMLESKRTICEHVLKDCVLVRNQVWPAFLREAAPTIKLAETKIESNFRQSCLTNISNCIQKACKDDIAGKGTATMDACLARPDMARSFCKVEIDPCERMEPQIFAYVTDKLAAMRVDACTQEVKDCFTADTRCGENFQNCIGMDYDYIHDICPIDKLVVCKQNNPKFSMDDLDSMLMGLYLNIDNAVMEQCQQLVDSKMTEVCGSTTDCNKFAADDTLGTGSLHSQKDGSIYRVTGMISFGSIKMGDASGKTKDGDDEDATVLGPGELGVREYLAQIRSVNASVANKDAIISNIEAELNNIVGTINRTIEMIEQDPKIQFCISGRNLEQITGKKEKTSARFPNLLNQVKMQIALSALRQAQDNYNKKFTDEVAKATKDSSDDIAQYVCQMLPHTNGAIAGTATNTSTTLTEPYAISYEVGAGLTSDDLLKASGKGTTNMAGASVDSTAGASKFGEAVNSFTGLGGDKVKMELSGGTREMWAIFNRETRTCHYCTSTITRNCKSESKKGFLGIGAKKELNCDESAPVEKCEDIKM